MNILFNRMIAAAVAAAISASSTVHAGEPGGLASPAAPVDPEVTHAASLHESAGLADEAASEPVSEADLNERAGMPLIVIVIVRTGVKVVVTTCTKSSACTSTAASVARKLGGAVAGAFFGGSAYATFCASKLGQKYGYTGPVRICR